MKHTFLLVMFVGFTVLGWRPTPAPAGVGESPSIPAALAAPWGESFRRFRLQGAGSCAAAACHNANEAAGRWGSEYTTWVIHDKHARAYEILFDERAKRILAAVERLADWKAARPDRTPLCMNCHVYPELEKQPQRADYFRREDGVSCEACHGPAEKWLSRHFRWRGLSAVEKAELGMRDTKSLVGRAGVCVACHVGQPGSEVNHDLIAAGHPRLAFEFGAYQASMPHHWNVAKDIDRRFDRVAFDPHGRKPGPDFEARAWLIGQLVSAQASLTLLEHRAGDDKAAWPEFADYACYACHHRLQPKSWRQDETARGKRKPGSPQWGNWYLSMPKYLAERDPRLRSLTGSLTNLETTMAGGDPSRSRVVSQAAAARKDLAGLLEHHRRREFADAGAIRKELTRMVDEFRPTDWDSACQLYLGLGGLERAWHDMKPSPKVVAPTLRDLARSLSFARGVESPEDDFFESFREHIETLKKQLRAAEDAK